MKKNLTILLLTNNYRPYCSGVANALDELHCHLRKAGHASSIVTLDFLGEKQNEEQVFRLYSPIRFTYKKNPMAVPLLPYQELKGIIKKLRPDIIHVHHPFLLGKVGLALGKKYKIPVVFTYHTQYEKYLHYVPLPEKITQPIVLKLVNDFCKQVDGIIVPTLSIKNEILNRTNIAAPLTVIPSSIKKSYFLDYEKKLGSTPIKLLTVSRFVKEKNIEFLLRAFKMLDKRFTLTLLGYGQYEAFLKHYAYQELQLLPDQVQFITSPSQELLQSWYKKADLFLFASRSETQGLVLAEAMAAGNPIIALDAAGSHDIIEHGKNGYLISSEDSMCSAIHTIINNHQEYEILSKNALRTAQLYQPEVITSKIIDWYRTLLIQIQ